MESSYVSEAEREIHRGDAAGSLLILWRPPSLPSIFRLVLRFWLLHRLCRLKLFVYVSLPCIHGPLPTLTQTLALSI